MNMQQNKAKIGIGALIILALLGLSLLVFAGQTQMSPLSAVARAAAANSLPTSAAPQTAIYIQFDIIPGECTEKDHQGWCNVLSFSQDQSLPNAMSASSGGGAGRVNLKDLIVTKPIDKASPKLAQAVWQGVHHKRVRIDVAKVLPTGPKTYLAYELTDVIITGCHVTGSAGAQSQPTEEISLSYHEIKTTYTEYDNSGAAKGSGTASFKVG
jgi:type VI secretion system secreted protein Hcp